MTCVVGLVENGTVYMGADSLAGGASGWDMRLRIDSKVFRRGNYLLGFTSSWRMGQLLHHRLDLPTIEEGVVAHAWVVDVFVERARACFKQAGYTKIDNNREEAGQFMLGFGGHLFVIDSDFGVGAPLDSYAAIGCGDQLAHGALYGIAQVRDGWSPRERIRIALEAAERFSAGVRGPFTIEELHP